MANAQLGAVIGYVRNLAAAQRIRDQTDGELLRAFLAQNDQAAFTVLVKRHGPWVLGVCHRVLHHFQDAEDAFQATFLLLARKAASIRKKESLVSWLHGVAYRMARDAKRAAFRRRKYEGEANRVHPTTPAGDAAWREVQAILDEEIGRLPEIYRQPFILCCLENRGRAEVARQLEVKEATVRSRLAHARKLLQQRLGRRGVSLSALLGALALSENTAGAAVSNSLVSATVKAALAFGAGHVARTGVISAPVAALVERGIKTMFMTKLKVGTAMLLAVGIAAGAGLLTHQVSAEKSAEAAQPAASQALVQDNAKTDPVRRSEQARGKGPKREGEDTVKVRGQVLDRHGKPAAGAKVSVCFPSRRGWLTTAADGEAQKPLHAVADGDGRFAIPVPRWARDMGVKVVATADGTGPDWVDVSAHTADKAVTLRLRADDVAIEGRILDLERRPVAGAAVEVGSPKGSLERPADGGDLKAWLATRLSELMFPRAPMNSLQAVGGTGIPVSVTTDKAGRFRLAGFGRETVVHLHVRGEGVETTDIAVCTRDDKAALIPQAGIYPARFELLLGPGKVVTGTVTEKGTGKPLAGAAVHVDWNYGHTDDKGRYRLTGIGKRDTHWASARGPRHFTSRRDGVPDSTGAEPITIDFELQPAREIRGRLSDKDGRPVRGFVWYSARSDNPNLKDLNAPARAIGVEAGMATMADGTFRLLAIPGPGYLGAKAEEDRFTCAEFKEWKGSDDAAFRDAAFRIPGWRGDLVAAVPAHLVPSHCHALVDVEPSPDDAKSWTRDIVLDPGKAVKGALVGADGKPVAGAFAFGLTAIMTTQPYLLDHPERITRLKGADFTAFGVNPREPRPLVFHHPEKNLGKLIVVRGDEKEPLEVRLEPLGTAAGRLIDSKGKPAAGIVIWPSIDLGRIALKDRKHLPGDLLYFAGHAVLRRPYPAPVTTDAKGHFTVAGLLPGIKYVFNWIPEVPTGGYTFVQLATVSVEAGKATLDLGDIKRPDLP